MTTREASLEELRVQVCSFKGMDQVEQLAVKPVLKSDADINNPATKGLVALAVLAVLPVALPVPVNLNIIATASLCVFVGCWRSVKASPPEDSMSRKVSSDISCKTFIFISMLASLLFGETGILHLV